MKKTFNLLMIAALGCGVLTFSSCSDESGDDPTPGTTETSTKCYMTQEQIIDDVETETINYTYDSDDNVILAVSSYPGEEGDSTSFTYSGGKLASAYDGYTKSTFMYEGTSTIPNRIDIEEGGVDAGYILLTVVGNNITKVENHYFYESDDVIEDETTVEYDASGNITSAIVKEYNEDTKMLEPFMELSNVVNDGKKNPRSESFAFFYMNSDNPTSFGTSNVTSASLTVSGIPTTMTASMTYNEHDYPTEMTATVLGFSNQFKMTYNCK